VQSAAVRRGLEEAAGEVVVIQDADLEYDPLDYLKLLQPIDDGLADVVFGFHAFSAGRAACSAIAQLANRMLPALQPTPT